MRNQIIDTLVYDGTISQRQAELIRHYDIGTSKRREISQEILKNIYSPNNKNNSNINKYLKT